MKKLFKTFFSLILIIPVIFLCSCGERSKLPKLNVEVYYEEKVDINVYGETTTKQINLNALTSSKPSDSNLNSYTQLVLTGKGNWLYKMYIDCIYFYVYTNEATPEEMIINFKLTNVVKESEFDKDSRTPTEFVCERSLKPTKRGSTLCKIPVNMTIADAKLTSITIDILNSTNGTIADDEGNLSSFRWSIYGFEIYGESRSYSK